MGSQCVFCLHFGVCFQDKLRYWKWPHAYFTNNLIHNMYTFMVFLVMWGKMCFSLLPKTMWTIWLFIDGSLKWSLAPLVVGTLLPPPSQLCNICRLTPCLIHFKECEKAWAIQLEKLFWRFLFSSPLNQCFLLIGSPPKSKQCIANDQ